MTLTTRVLVYARYSTSHQDPKSIGDQARECADYAAARPDWRIVASLRRPRTERRGDGALRPGYPADARRPCKAGRVDVVLVDDLSRPRATSPNRSCSFASCSSARSGWSPCADGEINVLTLTMRSAMNSQYLDTVRNGRRAAD